jgi:hypothetical protein
MEASQYLKNHECRQLLEQLQEQGWFRLPPVRRLGPARSAPGVSKLVWDDACGDAWLVMQIRSFL